jgi:hypothetical protein
MKTSNLCFLVLAVIFPLFVISQGKPASSIKAGLEKLPGVKSVEVLPCDTFFKEKYLLRVEQPVNHHKKNGDTFLQRVYVGFSGTEQPTVFVTEGYNAGYAGNPRYINELCPLLGANEVVVEHRYFGESEPEPNDWKFLTIEQAAADHHRINEMMKTIFHRKFVSTGISKGGQTTMYYKYFYPDDIAVAVPYVGPLNFSVDDARVNPFIQNIGSKDCRDKIRDFQIEVLKKKDALMPAFFKLANDQDYHFEYVGGAEATFEYSVLEYPFAFWQWGFIPCEAIPDENPADSTLLKHFLSVSPMDYFADEGIRQYWPFFYQALTEIGYYGYDTTDMGQYFEAINGLTFSFCAPEGTHPKFGGKKMKKVDKFLKSKGNNMIYLYGEYDPWSSTAFEPKEGNTNALKVVKAGGSHTTRILNLPDNQRTQVSDSLEKWLNVKIKN